MGYLARINIRVSLFASSRLRPEVTTIGAYAWLQPYLTKVSWDPLGDLAPITLAMSSPNVLVVHPSLPVKSVKELIALAKARPGELNYGAGGGGSTPHIAAELFKHMANGRIVRVNYKGSGA